MVEDVRAGSPCRARARELAPPLPLGRSPVRAAMSERVAKSREACGTCKLAALCMRPLRVDDPFGEQRLM